MNSIIVFALALFALLAVWLALEPFARLRATRYLHGVRLRVLHP